MNHVETVTDLRSGELHVFALWSHGVAATVIYDEIFHCYTCSEDMTTDG